jgi:FkbM family methyltransferase
MATQMEAGGGSLRGKIVHAMARSEWFRGVYGACRRVPVLGSLLHAGANGLLPHGTRVWSRLPEGLGKGLWFYSDPRFELGYANGDHEPWVQELLRSNLLPGDCCYDVGGHTGFFSLIAARFVGEKGLVVALEADPENAALLRGNAARNGMAQVRAIEAAAWSSSGKLTFERASPASNRTEGRVAQDGTARGAAITVAAVSLDDLQFGQGERAPNLVKMDVEGAEWEVLQGSQRLLRQMKPSLLCEVHDVGMIEKIQAFLRGFGYTTEHSQPAHPHYPDYKQHYVWAIAAQQHHAAG